MRTHDLALARVCAIPASVATCVGLVVGAVIAGWAGVAGALVAGAVTLVFFGSGLLVSARTSTREPRAGMTIAVLAHAGKVVAGGILLVVLREADFYDADVLAVTLVVVTSAWLAGHVWGMHHLKMFVVDSVPSRGGSAGVTAVTPVIASALDPRSESAPKG